jgi:hypothetical protein
MWGEAIVRSYRARAAINATMAEMQAEIERACPCKHDRQVRGEPVRDSRSPEHTRRCLGG